MSQGGKRSGAGRPKGVQNKNTEEFKLHLNALLENSAPKMQKWLEDIAEESPEKAFDILSKFAEYIHPKLARTENKNSHDGEITLTLNKRVFNAGDND